MPDGQLPPPPPPPRRGPPPFPPTSPPITGPQGLPPPVLPPGTYRTRAPQPAARGVRRAAAILLFVSVGTVWIVGFVAFARQRTWDDFIDGQATIADVDDADSAIGGATLIAMLAMLATAILVSIWSHRAVENGASRGADVSPGLTAGGWFIPFGNLVVPFIQLRRAVGERGRRTMVTVWQVTWTIGMVTLLGATQLFDDEDLGQSPAKISDSLRSQGWGVIASGVLLAVAAGFAIAAMHDVDAATSS